MARRVHGSVSRSDVQAVVDAIMAQYPYLSAASGDWLPTIMQDFDGAEWTIVWEEGPFQWPYLFPYGGIEEEFGTEVEDVFALLPDNVFVEAATHYSVNVYDASVLDVTGARRTSRRKQAASRYGLPF